MALLLPGPTQVAFNFLLTRKRLLYWHKVLLRRIINVDVFSEFGDGVPLGDTLRVLGGRDAAEVELRLRRTHDAFEFLLGLHPSGHSFIH